MLAPKKDGDQIVLVSDDGSKSFPVTEKVWKILSNPEILMDDFKKVLQSYALETNREWAMILKQECPSNADYRDLRVSIRSGEF